MMNGIKFMNFIFTAFVSSALMAGGQQAKSGGGASVSIVASTNVSSQVLVQTIAPDGSSSVRVFKDGQEVDSPVDSADAPKVTWLGVTTEEASDELRAQLSLDPGAGLTVYAVAPESPAAEAGLQVHDILVRFEDQILMNPDQLSKLVRARKPGDKVKLSFLRKGREKNITVKLGERVDSLRDGPVMIDLGEFDLDLGKLMVRMPQLGNTFQGKVFNVSTGWNFRFDGDGSGNCGMPGTVDIKIIGGDSIDSGGMPTAEEILKQLKVDDPRIKGILDEAMKAMENKGKEEK